MFGAEEGMERPILLEEISFDLIVKKVFFVNEEAIEIPSLISSSIIQAKK